MAKPGVGNSSKQIDDETESRSDTEDAFLPGYATLEDYSEKLISQVMLATKASNGLPDQGDDYDYYTSFPGYKTFCNKMGDRINRMIGKLLRQQQLPCYWPADKSGVEADDKFETLVEANDALLERVSVLLDEASGLTKNEQPVLPQSEIQRGTAEVASWNTKTKSVRSAVNSYNFIHSKSVERPQLKFKYQVDNSNSPFIPLIRHKPHAKVPLPEVFQKLQNPTSLSVLITNTKEWVNSDQKEFHPYKFELDTLSYLDSQLQLRDPQSPGSLEDTPLTIVTTVEQLEALKNELIKVKEFAVDLEHHSYRSYIGFVCLMQISTRSHDYLIDTLELRHHMHTLLDPFTNPHIVKVLHGAEFDIQWLQRDFGLYVVNMFDTGQASRTLGLPRYSLAFLLQYCCSVEADKQFQLADWRIRPLPPEMIKYAREDTHYLLYIYDRMSNELIRRSNKRGNLIRAVLDQSKSICARPYLKPIITEDSYLNLYLKHKRRFNSQQLHCLQLLYKWRDNIARQEDESTGFVLPNHMLFQISEILPREPQGILACCNPIPTLLRQQLQEVNIMVQSARNAPLTSVLPTISNLSKEKVTEKEATDSDEPEQKHKKVKVHGPPIQTAEPVLTAFSDSKSTVTKTAQEKCTEIVQSFPNFLSQYLEPKEMSPSEVLQMQRSYSVVSAGTDSPLNRKSPLATPTQSSFMEIDERSTEKVKKDKKRLSVREMGREKTADDGEASGSESPPVKRKSSNGKGKRKGSGDFKPFDYEGADFGQFTKQGREVKVFSPHSDQGSKEQRRSTKSKVHQKFSERSQSYIPGKEGGRRPKGGK